MNSPESGNSLEDSSEKSTKSTRGDGRPSMMNSSPSSTLLNDNPLIIQPNNTTLSPILESRPLHQRFIPFPTSNGVHSTLGPLTRKIHNDISKTTDLKNLDLKPHSKIAHDSRIANTAIHDVGNRKECESRVDAHSHQVCFDCIDTPTAAPNNTNPLCSSFLESSVLPALSPLYLGNAAAMSSHKQRTCYPSDTLLEPHTSNPDTNLHNLYNQEQASSTPSTSVFSTPQHKTYTTHTAARPAYPTQAVSSQPNTPIQPTTTHQFTAHPRSVPVLRQTPTPALPPPLPRPTSPTSSAALAGDTLVSVRTTVASKLIRTPHAVTALQSPPQSARNGSAPDEGKGARVRDASLDRPLNRVFLGGEREESEYGCSGEEEVEDEEGKEDYNTSAVAQVQVSAGMRRGRVGEHGVGSGSDEDSKPRREGLRGRRAFSAVSATDTTTHAAVLGGRDVAAPLPCRGKKALVAGPMAKTEDEEEWTWQDASELQWKFLRKVIFSEDPEIRVYEDSWSGMESPPLLGACEDASLASPAVEEDAVEGGQAEEAVVREGNVAVGAGANRGSSMRGGSAGGGGGGTVADNGESVWTLGWRGQDWQEHPTAVPRLDAHAQQATRGQGQAQEHGGRRGQGEKVETHGLSGWVARCPSLHPFARKHESTGPGGIDDTHADACTGITPREVLAHAINSGTMRVYKSTTRARSPPPPLRTGGQAQLAAAGGALSEDTALVEAGDRGEHGEGKKDQADDEQGCEGMDVDVGVSTPTTRRDITTTPMAATAVLVATDNSSPTNMAVEAVTVSTCGPEVAVSARRAPAVVAGSVATITAHTPHADADAVTTRHVAISTARSAHDTSHMRSTPMATSPLSLPAAPLQWLAQRLARVLRLHPTADDSDDAQHAHAKVSTAASEAACMDLDSATMSGLAMEHGPVRGHPLTTRHSPALLSPPHADYARMGDRVGGHARDGEYASTSACGHRAAGAGADGGGEGGADRGGKQCATTAESGLGRHGDVRAGGVEPREGDAASITRDGLDGGAQYLGTADAEGHVTDVERRRAGSLRHRGENTTSEEETQAGKEGKEGKDSSGGAAATVTLHEEPTVAMSDTALHSHSHITTDHCTAVEDTGAVPRDADLSDAASSGASVSWRWRACWAVLRALLVVGTVACACALWWASMTGSDSAVLYAHNDNTAFRMVQPLSRAQVRAALGKPDAPLIVFHERQLALLNGTSLTGGRARPATAPLYTAVLGTVFDVTGLWETFGPRGDMHSAVGRDATRMFATQDFSSTPLSRMPRRTMRAPRHSAHPYTATAAHPEPQLAHAAAATAATAPTTTLPPTPGTPPRAVLLTPPSLEDPSPRGLAPQELLTAFAWREYLLQHAQARPMGVLAGHYYDAAGRATPLLRRVDAALAVAATARHRTWESTGRRELSAAAHAAVMGVSPCRSLWSPTKGGLAYCDQYAGKNTPANADPGKGDTSPNPWNTGQLGKTGSSGSGQIPADVRWRGRVSKVRARERGDRRSSATINQRYGQPQGEEATGGGGGDGHGEIGVTAGADGAVGNDPTLEDEDMFASHVFAEDASLQPLFYPRTLHWAHVDARALAEELVRGGLAQRLRDRVRTGKRKEKGVHEGTASRGSGDGATLRPLVSPASVSLSLETARDLTDAAVLARQREEALFSRARARGDIGALAEAVEAALAALDGEDGEEGAWDEEEEEPEAEAHWGGAPRNVQRAPTAEAEDTAAARLTLRVMRVVQRALAGAEWESACVCVTDAHIAALEKRQGVVVASVLARAMEAEVQARAMAEVEVEVEAAGVDAAGPVAGGHGGAGGSGKRARTLAALQHTRTMNTLATPALWPRLQRKVGSLHGLFGSRKRVRAMRRSARVRHAIGAYDAAMVKAALGGDYPWDGTTERLRDLGNTDNDWYFSPTESETLAMPTRIRVMQAVTQSSSDDNAGTGPEGEFWAAESGAVSAGADVETEDAWDLGVDMDVFFLTGAIVPLHAHARSPGGSPTRTGPLDDLSPKLGEYGYSHNARGGLYVNGTHRAPSNPSGISIARAHAIPPIPDAMPLRVLSLLPGCHRDALVCAADAPAPTAVLHGNRNGLQTRPGSMMGSP